MPTSVNLCTFAVVCCAQTHIKDYADELAVSQTVYLEPEPTNKWDPKAIKVMSGADRHIGYVPAKLCQYLHPYLRIADKPPAHRAYIVGYQPTGKMKDFMTVTMDVQRRLDIQDAPSEYVLRNEPTERDLEASDFLRLLDGSDDITPTNWELGFIKNCLERKTFSPGQLVAIDKMKEKYQDKL